MTGSIMTGSIEQIIGAVVDVKFPRGNIPKIYDALVVPKHNLTLEVQQQLGDGKCRTYLPAWSSLRRTGPQNVWPGRGVWRLRLPSPSATSDSEGS